MSYVTKQELISRFGEEELIQLTDRAGAGVIDDQVLDRAIADADAEIDGYLGSRYSLPLSVIPASLNRIAADIARYYLYEDAATEHVRQRYEDAVRFLRAISEGKVSLGIDPSGAGAKPASGATMTSGGRVFTREDDGFI